MTKEELIAEEYICNGKCQDDITKNYIHCKTCTRLNDFLTGYRAGNTELKKEIKCLEDNSSLREGILWNDIHNRDKKIRELAAQINKMKCCQNCKHSEEDNKSSTICDGCFELCCWEMKE